VSNLVYCNTYSYVSYLYVTLYCNGKDISWQHVVDLYYKETARPIDEISDMSVN